MVDNSKEIRLLCAFETMLMLYANVLGNIL